MEEKPAATKKATVSNFYHQYYNTFSFMQPVLPDQGITHIL